MSADIALFDLVPAPIAAPEPADRLSADQRRTMRQRAGVDAGRHPLNGAPLLIGPSLTCGTCRWRELLSHNSRSYPKCTWRASGAQSSAPLVTHGAASDVRAWWPACPHYGHRDTAALRDPLAVDAVVAGSIRGDGLDTVDRREVVRRLTVAGRTGAEIAHVLATTYRTVERDRAWLRARGALDTDQNGGTTRA